MMDLFLTAAAVLGALFFLARPVVQYWQRTKRGGGCAGGCGCSAAKGKPWSAAK